MNLSDSINAHFNCTDADVEVDEFAMCAISRSLTIKVRGIYWDVFYTRSNEVRRAVLAA